MEKGLYIQMHSMHGLFRGTNLELGRDEDTGGQIIYVLDLAKALGKHPDVEKVEIVTRHFQDERYPGYSRKKEKVSDNVHIIRIPCGPKRYIKKVKLWPYLEQFIKNTIEYYERTGRQPDILHSNYADSGYVCTEISKRLGIPQVHTGHSLGKPKMHRLGVSDSNYAEMDKKYHFTERLKAEEAVIEHASAIITSTNEERLNQYGLYHVNVADPKFHVVPPGINIEAFNPPGTIVESESDLRARKKINKILAKNLKDPDKPPILALSRLDYRKNIITLVKAFVYDETLIEMSNLSIFVGRFGKFGKQQKILLKEINELIKKTSTEDNICLPNIDLNFEKDVPVLYRMFAEKKGVFVNPALIEPFGLTVLEAPASGLPVVATKNGGPSEIITEDVNGYTIDPRDHCDIAYKIKHILEDPERWRRFSVNGRKNVLENYTWAAAAEREAKIFKKLIKHRS